jgi:hypothetical protein
MIALSRWWRSLTHRQSGIEQGSPEVRARKESHLAVRSDRSTDMASDSSHLCERCKRLGLLTYVEGPPSPPKTDSIRGFMVAKIDKNSIDMACALCTQLSQFFYHSALVPSSLATGQSRSFELWCHHTSQYEQSTTYFFIQYRGIDRKLRIFLMKPMILRGFFDTSMEQTHWPRRLQEDSFARTTNRLYDQVSVDIDVLKEWTEWCNSNHQHVCGGTRQGRIRPDRLIDCSRRELCTSDGPYVCLSYVWGSNLPDQKAVGNALPHEMPSTISDAMEVTLKLGLRYLWVDRYCINQDDEDERHNIIRNMDAICEFVTVHTKVSHDFYTGSAPIRTHYRELSAKNRCNLMLLC